jgi:hypothetical protein
MTTSDESAAKSTSLIGDRGEGRLVSFVGSSGRLTSSALGPRLGYPTLCARPDCV